MKVFIGGNGNLSLDDFYKYFDHEIYRLNILPILIVPHKQIHSDELPHYFLDLL